MEPPLGHLHVVDDEDAVQVYEVSVADFNAYESDGHYWLTIYMRARALALPDGEDPEPWLEINRRFSSDPHPLLTEHQVFKVEPYDDELGNLTNLYYWTHVAFDGEVLVERADAQSLVLRVAGDTDADPIVLRAVFSWNPMRHRSVS
jgi:hypothetical protein